VYYDESNAAHEALGRAARQLSGGGALYLGAGVGAEKRRGPQGTESYALTGVPSAKVTAGPLAAVIAAFTVAGQSTAPDSPGGGIAVSDPAAAARLRELVGQRESADRNLREYAVRLERKRARAKKNPEPFAPFAETTPDRFWEEDRIAEIKADIQRMEAERAALLATASKPAAVAEAWDGLLAVTCLPGGELTEELSESLAVELLVESAKTAGYSVKHKDLSTPGGRKNWIEKTGQLPAYIQNIAAALIREGKTKGTAISIAISRVRAWASGAGNVSAEVKAAAAKAVAEFEALRAKNKARTAAREGEDTGPAPLVEHFIGRRHPRDRKGQWTERGPGGTLGGSPLPSMRLRAPDTTPVARRGSARSGGTGSAPQGAVNPKVARETQALAKSRLKDLKPGEELKVGPVTAKRTATGFSVKGGGPDRYAGSTDDAAKLVADRFTADTAAKQERDDPRKSDAAAAKIYGKGVTAADVREADKKSGSTPQGVASARQISGRNEQQVAKSRAASERKGPSDAEVESARARVRALKDGERIELAGSAALVRRGDAFEVEANGRRQFVLKSVNSGGAKMSAEDQAAMQVASAKRKAAATPGDRAASIVTNASAKGGRSKGDIAGVRRELGTDKTGTDNTSLATLKPGESRDESGVTYSRSADGRSISVSRAASPGREDRQTFVGPKAEQAAETYASQLRSGSNVNAGPAGSSQATNFRPLAGGANTGFGGGAVGMPQGFPAGYVATRTGDGKIEVKDRDGKSVGTFATKHAGLIGAREDAGYTSTRDRREAKADRYETAAERNAQRAASARSAAANDPVRQSFPLGVGPSGRRNAPAAGRSGADAYQAERDAERQRAAAASVRNSTKRAIYTNDENAPDALRARADQDQKRLDAMKERNKAFRAANKELLKGKTAYEKDQLVPHPSWQITNLGAKIRKDRKRAQALESVEHGAPSLVESFVKFDETKHKRGAKGTSQGGKFVASGDSGTQVRTVQHKLGVTTDGKFGAKTRAAVEAFQAQNHLQVDGVVGRQTAAALAGAKNASSVKPGALSRADERDLAKLRSSQVRRRSRAELRAKAAK
jgi:hypothetical protein